MEELVPKIIDIPLHLDDRGSVYGAFDNLDKFGIKRTYVVRNWQPGLIRAWHGHEKASTYIHVVKGAAKICARPIYIEGAVNDLLCIDNYRVSTLSAAKPQLFYIPPGWFNGTMTLQEDTRLLVYSTLTLDEVRKDDIRGAISKQEFDKVWKVLDR